MKNENDVQGVPGAEPPVGPSATSPQAITPSGLSASVPDAPAHTPGPWSVMEKGFSRKHPCPVVYKADTSLRYIAHCDDFASDPPTDNLANAEFIVEAANSYYPSKEIIEKHEQRIAELESMLTALCELQEEEDRFGYDSAFELHSSGKWTEARAFLKK